MPIIEYPPNIYLQIETTVCKKKTNHQTENLPAIILTVCMWVDGWMDG